MANSDFRFGLQPIRNGIGAPWNAGMAQPYYIPVGYATALYVGDPVIVTGDLNSVEHNSNPVGTLQIVSLAAAAGGTYLSGSIVGFDPLWSDLTKQYNPASTARIAYVCDDPEAIFTIQEDGDTTPLAVTSGSNNADLITTHDGSTVTGLSGFELDSSTINTTNSLQLRVLRLYPTLKNEIGEFAVWEVKINLHTSRYLTGVA